MKSIQLEIKYTFIQKYRIVIIITIIKIIIMIITTTKIITKL